MSVAYRCERCEGYGPNEPVAIVTVATKEPMPQGKASKEYDLCGKCLDEMREWLTPFVDDVEAPEVVPASALSIDVPFGGSRHPG